MVNWVRFRESKKGLLGMKNWHGTLISDYIIKILVYDAMQRKFIINKINMHFIVIICYFSQWCPWAWCKGWCAISAGRTYQHPWRPVSTWQRAASRNVLLTALTAQSTSLQQWSSMIVPKSAKSEVSTSFNFHSETFFFTSKNVPLTCAAAFPLYLKIHSANPLIPCNLTTNKPML